MANVLKTQASKNATAAFIVAALAIVAAGFYFRQLQLSLTVAALLLVFRAFRTETDKNVRRLAGVLTLYLGASTLSNAAWYLVPSVADLEIVGSPDYYYATGMFWLGGFAVLAYALLRMKTSRQWYIDPGLDRMATAIGIVGIFISTLLVALNLRLDSPHLVDIIILLAYLWFDGIILTLTLKLLCMNLPWDLKALVYIVLLFFSINAMGDLLFECRWLFGLDSLMSYSIVGRGWTLTVRNMTDLIYEVSLALLIVCMISYVVDPFRSRMLADTRRRLRETQLFVDDLLAKSPEATCIFGRDGRLLLINDAFLATFGLERKDISHSFNIFNHLGQWVDKYPEYGQVLQARNGETVIVPKIMMHGIKGGRPGNFYISLKVFPTLDTGGRIANYVMTVSDITDRVRLEDDLMDAYSHLKEEYERKIDFTNAAAHELRTPLTPIIGYTDILKSEVSDERHKKYLEIIERNAIRQKNMVNRMLELASLDAGMAHVHIEEFPVLPLVNEVADNYRTVNPGIRVDVPEGMRVRTDADALRHVLDNLVSNAVKYSASGGRIEIKAVDAGDRFQFSVEDHGAGIPREEWGRIFERFYLVGGDQDNRTGGRVGLGLTLVRAYVNLIGGTVWLDSEPGKGSTFFFTVPKAPQAAGQPANV